jgi:MioC protein
MSDKILILVATMSGAAELAAEEMADRIDADGGAAAIRRMEKADPSKLNSYRAVLICSSTYGKGDVPDNGKALFEQLQAQRPDLTGLLYGVVALGDSIYPQTFCFGGRKFDELLSSLGAVRIGERLQHDSRGGDSPDRLAGEWVEDWYAQLNALETRDEKLDC